MKNLLIILGVLFLFGCGTKEVKFKSPQSCHVEDVDGGAVIFCDDGTEVFIADGEDGTDGTDGTDGESGVVEIVDPCGDYPDHFDELLFVTADGDIISYFKENGSREFLTLLTPGQYQTTDRQKCDFEIESDGTITW